MPGPRLVERESELRAIEQAVGEAGGGNGVSALIRGPAGIGKSGLLHVACDIARAAGLNVLVARGGELERDFAYGVVRQLLERPVVRAPARERRRLLEGSAALAEPALGLATGGVSQSPYPGDSGFATMHGLYWVVSNLAESGPLMLAVDDLHWSDSPSLRFIAYPARRLEGLPVLTSTGRDRARICRVDRNLPQRLDAVEIVLRFDEPSDPIRGSVREPGGDEHEFAGWLGLVTALEQALQGQRP